MGDAWASYAAAPPTVLTVAGRPVADYVDQPNIDPVRGPRPFLHPVRTLGGVVVTDVLPADHPHHLGVSVAMQDVSGHNLWGGRTYVRGVGYSWLDDHGDIVQTRWRERTDHRLSADLRWRTGDGTTLLTEERVVTARELPGRDDAWVLEIEYTLINPNPRPVTLGSPGTNGRPGNAGYGGFFWRAAPGTPEVFTAKTEVEAEVNGSFAPWVALRESAPQSAYTLIFSGLGEGDHWFVRATEYPGVCVALAFTEVRRLAQGDRLRRRHRIVVADGALTVDEAAAFGSGAPLIDEPPGAVSD